MARLGSFKGAAEHQLQLDYAELHRLATSHVRSERQDHMLQPTALINEAYCVWLAGEVVDQNAGGGRSVGIVS